jgi:hypothetical protein
MGTLERRHPLHALVPPPNGPHGGKAHGFSQCGQRRTSPRILLGGRTHSERARRLLSPLGGNAFHLRGPRIHRLGSHQPRLRRRQWRRRHALHSFGVLFL